MPRFFLGRLGDGVDPTLRVVRAGDKFRFGVLFIDVLNPSPDPGGGTGFRNIHAGFFTVVFLPFPDIPYFTHTLFGVYCGASGGDDAL